MVKTKNGVYKRSRSWSIIGQYDVTKENLTTTRWPQFGKISEFYFMSMVPMRILKVKEFSNEVNSSRLLFTTLVGFLWWSYIFLGLISKQLTILTKKELFLERNNSNRMKLRFCFLASLFIDKWRRHNDESYLWLTKKKSLNQHLTTAKKRKF